MISEMERRLAEFVDREAEMRTFCEVIEAGVRPIMVVWGDGGLGKSSLLARMIHECALRNLRKAEVVWTDTRNHDYLSIMRKLRDDLGPLFFQLFTDLVNYFTVPKYDLQVRVSGSISVAQGAGIEGSTVGDIGGVIIKDSMIVVPRGDIGVSENDRMIRLTDCFMNELEAAIDGVPVVVFFDAVEKMATETHRWVWGELLRAVPSRGLRNIRFVLCGRNRPDLSDRDMQLQVEEAELHPLELIHIMEYLAKRGVEEAHREPLAYAAMGKRDNLLEIAKMVDSYFVFKRKMSRANG